MKKNFITLINEKLDLEKPLTLKDAFKNSEDWDSMNTLNLMSFLDEEYEIVLSSEDIERFEIVEDIADFVQQKCQLNLKKLNSDN